MKVIIDNGHGNNTPGKRSPKGMLTDPGMTALYEYEFNRDIACRLTAMLDESDIDYHLLVPETHDVPLDERCDRANEIYRADRDSFLVSIHANAGGGTGFEVFTSVGDTPADPIAQVFAEKYVQHFPEFRLRKDEVDGDWDKESQFYILKNTILPAILTENGFMDHPKDLEFIISDNGRERIARHHHDSILTVINLGLCYQIFGRPAVFSSTSANPGRSQMRYRAAMTLAETRTYLMLLAPMKRIRIS
jgi:N-acetylmuramoyl-L-alanine amidase